MYTTFSENDLKTSIKKRPHLERQEGQRLGLVRTHTPNVIIYKRDYNPQLWRSLLRRFEGLKPHTELPRPGHWYWEDKSP